ncbi:MAG: HIRAN domain-containing protein [Bacteroidales bacterium]|nr:HIRAN domain-containing protein [Bacteroidales bacterium]
MFDYKNENACCELDQETLMLLEAIDAYEYTLLNPEYECLGDLHAALENVHVKNSVGERVYTVQMTIKEIKDLMEQWAKINDRIRAHNDRIRISIKDCKDEERQKALRMQLIDESEYKPVVILLIELRKHNGEPDDTLIDMTSTHTLTGYYSRVSGNVTAGYVALKYTKDSYALATTYIHEMMHALYDVDLSKPMNDAEFAEEPLAEYGMLHFVQEFVKAHPQYKDLMTYALKKVHDKQQSIGLAHYGFGFYLFQNFQHVEWEMLMCAAHGKVDNANAPYTELQKMLQGAFPIDTQLAVVADKLYEVLHTAAGTRCGHLKPIRCSAPCQTLTGGGALLETFRVAGLPFKDDFGVVRAHDIRCLSAGDKLYLKRDAQNSHDANAIKLIRADGRELGFVPRYCNQVPATMMDAGMDHRLVAFISDLQPEGNFRDRFVEVELWVV